MTIQYDRYLRALRQNWWVILLALAIAVGIALVRASIATPIYRTSATFIISPAARIEDNADFMRGLNTLDQESVVLTYVEIMVANRTKRNAAAALDLSVDEIDAYEVSAIQLPDSNVLRVTVAGPLAGNVTDLANEIGVQAIAFGGSLYPVYEVQALDVAELPTSASSPTPAREAALAGVLGLGIGILIAVFANDLRSIMRAGILEPPLSGETVEAS